MVTTRSGKKDNPQVDLPKHASSRQVNAAVSDFQKKSTSVNKLNHQVTVDAKTKMNQLLSKLTSSSSTICPSQIARGLNKDSPAQYPDWRAMMDPVRDIVWREVEKGRVEVTQGGEVRTLEERDGLRGPIRVRRGGMWDSS
jgi:hypothetical protein